MALPKYVTLGECVRCGQQDMLSNEDICSECNRKKVRRKYQTLGECKFCKQTDKLDQFTVCRTCNVNRYRAKIDYEKRKQREENRSDSII